MASLLISFASAGRSRSAVEAIADLDRRETSLVMEIADLDRFITSLVTGGSTMGCGKKSGKSRGGKGKGRKGWAWR